MHICVCAHWGGRQRCGHMEFAESVFSKMLEKDVITWNLLIYVYVQVGEVDKALNVCRLMRPKNMRPSPTDGWPEGSFEPSGPPRFSKILIF